MSVVHRWGRVCRAFGDPLVRTMVLNRVPFLRVFVLCKICPTVSIGGSVARPLLGTGRIFFVRAFSCIACRAGEGGY